MRHRKAVLVLASMLSISCTFSQDHLYSISLYGTYTTSSELYFSPDDPDIFVRAQNLPMDHIFGEGIDVRRSFEESGVQVGLSIERIVKTEDVVQPVGNSTVVTVHDGYVAVPLELTGYFVMPFSSDIVQMYMGGGGGAYFGSRRYFEAGATAGVVDRSVGFGIHVLTGIQYNFLPLMGLRGELKFRDVQFNSTNAFAATAGYENTTLVPLSTQPFDSRITIDGMVMSLGLVYRF